MGCDGLFLVPLARCGTSGMCMVEQGAGRAAQAPCPCCPSPPERSPGQESPSPYLSRPYGSSATLSKNLPLKDGVRRRDCRTRREQPGVVCSIAYVLTASKGNKHWFFDIRS